MSNSVTVTRLQRSDFPHRKRHERASLEVMWILLFVRNVGYRRMNFD